MFVTVNRLVAGLFIVLLAGAAFFYMERILFLDASFILFRIINLGEFQIQEHRYGSFITQAFPLIATKLHLPIQVVALLYSISFNLFYLAVALLLLYKFRETALAVLMSFYYVLFVSETYFWTNNEVHQGIAWMFLCFGLMVYMGKKKTHPAIVLPVFTLLAFLSLFSHPLVMLPMAFLWLFFVLKKDYWPYPKTWTIIFTAILIVICIVKIRISTGSSSHYDVDKLHHATHLSFKKIFAAFTSPMAKEIIIRTAWNYWLVPILFFTGAWAAFRQKQYKHLALTLVFSVGYFVAICITFFDFVPFYAESEWMAGSIIFAALFVYYVLPQLQPRMALLALILIFSTRLLYISFAAEKWTERKEWIMGTLEEMRKKDISKAIVYEDETIRKTLIMNWGSPTESIIASAISGDQPTRSFIAGSEEEISKRLPVQQDQLLSSFETIQLSALHPFYFSMDTSAYVVLPSKP